MTILKEKKSELSAELEAEIRSKINPVYSDTRGTESYERKALIAEIDGLRDANVLLRRKLELLHNQHELCVAHVFYLNEIVQKHEPGCGMNLNKSKSNG